MSSTLPSGLTDPRPELSLCGHVVVEDQAFFFYDLRGSYLVTDGNGGNLTTFPSDSLADAFDLLAARFRSMGQ